MKHHVQHLLIAYVHGQLSSARRRQVAQHVQVCPACRAALVREERLARDIERCMPAIGAPRRGQLARLWPSIQAQITRGGRKPEPAMRLPSFGSLALLLVICCTFLLSAFVRGPGAQVAAAPLLPALPATIQTAQLTRAPMHTEAPVRTDFVPQALPTATAPFVPAMAVPMPDMPAMAAQTLTAAGTGSGGLDSRANR
jgi:anti-sigma factor RsiW